MKKLRIGIAGTRGIPNAYGGFEQFAEHLSFALVERGHEVTVYNSSRNPYKENEWRGVKIIRCNDPEKILGTAGQFIYDRNCIRDARKRNFDVLLHLGYTSSSIWWRKWPKNAVNMVNMDGLEWIRPKYSLLTKRFLKKAESWAAKHADHLIADSVPIQEYLMKTYGKTATYIPYGAEIFNQPDPSAIEKFSLSPYSYYLVIARMEPDNNIEMIIQGWMEAVGGQQPAEDKLIIVGNPDNKYGRYLKNKYQQGGIKFLGSIYEQSLLNNLRYYSKKYFHGHSAGGTNPSLLEAMACGCDIACHDNLFNQAVTGENADYFSSLLHVSQIILTNPGEQMRADRKKKNMQRILSEYDWQKIVNTYEKLMLMNLG